MEREEKAWPKQRKERGERERGDGSLLAAQFVSSAGDGEIECSCVIHWQTRHPAKLCLTEQVQKIEEERLVCVQEERRKRERAAFN